MIDPWCEQSLGDISFKIHRTSSMEPVVLINWDDWMDGCDGLMDGWTL